MGDVYSDNRTRDEVEALSRNCPHCGIRGGAGQLIVYHPQWVGSPIAWEPCVRYETDADGIEITVAGTRRFSAEVAAHCVCAAGRWLRERTVPELRRRFVDAADIVAGRSIWLFEPPLEITPAMRWKKPDTSKMLKKANEHA